MEDHHVDRPDVEARQRAQLTGTNRSFDLIVLIIKERPHDANGMTSFAGGSRQWAVGSRGAWARLSRAMPTAYRLPPTASPLLPTAYCLLPSFEPRP